MKRILITTVILLCAALSLSAGRTHDVSLSFGQYSDTSMEQEVLNLRYGATIGLTKRSEVMLWGASTLTPELFDENKAGLGLSLALQGNRSTGTKVQGPSCNTLVTLGLIASERNDENEFRPTSVYLSVTPFSLGTPIMGKRERMFEVGVEYNWCVEKFSIFISVLNLDYYIHGTWKDYYR
ncbi:MAG: hypothetical protein IJ831_02025 [Spirochaetales bacterium]|nr:hypothetical protein [Spirochaetales bacterium]